MVPFAGWQMPVQYSGIIEEHKATRTAAGLFDVSHMGELLVSGPEARLFLNYLLPNKVARLAPGKILYSPICYENGGTVDDVMVYAIHSEKFLICVNASNTDRDMEWISRHAKGYDCVVTDVSAEYFLLALQGPAWRKIAEICFPDVNEFPPRFSFSEINFEGETLILSRTGYTGEDGLEIYGSPAVAVKVADLLVAKGEEFGLKLAGLGSRDSLRLEAGLPLYGHELSEQISAVDAGLGWTVDWSKEDFIGRKELHRQKEGGSSHRVVFFVLDDRRIARQGTPVLNDQGQEVGQVLSGTLSPMLNKPIGSALIERSALKGNLHVSLRGNTIPLNLKKPPLHL
jgi:aminomethyltransferase